ncbi:minor capsid protein [Diplocloster agilis]|uniref:Minor capsid protein n=1 Tax=Diplocloster agilis TaxID=2850323 RepID=A0A949K3X1_9FIRM|nr:minor capsid protein [Diplocloster agilis]MBU9739329.1 minor capsid protein [Diplocloster agilis]
MPKITARVTFDTAAAAARIRAASNDALTRMGLQALEDNTQHVPHDQRFLQDSGFLNSDQEAENLSFWLRWEEPYSQYLFHGEVMYGNPTSRTYGPEKLNFTSALARMEWTKYAKEVYGDDWKKVYQAALKELMK